MKAGMLAAEAAFAALQAGDAEAVVLSDYPARLKESWVWDELYRARNIRPAFHLGLFAGIAYSAVDTFLLRGKAPWTLHHHRDNESLRPAAQSIPISYPKPDGVVTFDRLSSVFLSNTNHEENQPAHQIGRAHV